MIYTGNRDLSILHSLHTEIDKDINLIFVVSLTSLFGMLKCMSFTDGN